MKWQIPIGFAWACFGAGFGYWAAMPSVDLAECRETLTHCIDQQRHHARVAQVNYDDSQACFFELGRKRIRLDDANLAGEMCEADLKKLRAQWDHHMNGNPEAP